MSYLACPHCGQKALSVATRCPRCGLPFETQFLRHQPSGSKSSRIPLVLLITGAVAVVLLIVDALRQGPVVAPPVGLPAAAIESAPLPEPSRQPSPESLGALGDSVRPAPPRSPEPPNPAPVPAADSAELAAPSAAVESASSAAGERRYANTWTNVRAGRGGTTPVIRILRPGELVVVDSLDKGWYRVVTDEQAPGYVDRRFLDVSPPTPSP